MIKYNSNHLNFTWWASITYLASGRKPLILMMLKKQCFLIIIKKIYRTTLSICFGKNKTLQGWEIFFYIYRKNNKRQRQKVLVSDNFWRRVTLKFSFFFHFFLAMMDVYLKDFDILLFLWLRNLPSETKNIGSTSC